MPGELGVFVFFFFFFFFFFLKKSFLRFFVWKTHDYLLGNIHFGVFQSQTLDRVCFHTCSWVFNFQSACSSRCTSQTD